MKKYHINVHYDAVLPTVVEAETEEEALDKAVIATENISLDEAEIVDINSCVIYTENI